MKNKILTLTAIVFSAVIVLLGCQNEGEKNTQEAKASKGKTETDSLAAQSNYSDEWQKFKSDSDQKIKDNENSIAAFKEKMKKAGTKIKTKYNKEIANLEETNREMKKKLEEYKNDGKSTWVDFKTGFNKDMDKLGKAVKDLTSDND